MIKMQVIGHLGQDATVNNVNGRNVINFSVAHSEKYKNKEGNDIDKTIWVSCAYWSEKVNLAMYLKKATQIYVEGYPESRIYTDKSNVSQPQLAMRVTNVQLLGSKNTTPLAQNTQNDFLSQPNSFEETLERPI